MSNVNLLLDITAINTYVSASISFSFFKLGGLPCHTCVRVDPNGMGVGARAYFLHRHNTHYVRLISFGFKEIERPYCYKNRKIEEFVKKI